MSKLQRGFLPRRSLLVNVVVVDFEAMQISLRHLGEAISLFDFQAAFPSMSHASIMSSLTMLGVPPEIIHFMQALYDHNTCRIMVQGTDYDGFTSHSGVRQGCPLSPLIFAACIDILLRMINLRLPNLSPRAFADAIGIVLSDWNLELPLLASIFSEFAATSGLSLNVDKTVAIPLWEVDHAALRRETTAIVPAWSSVSIVDSGTYLGFKTGPGKATSSWESLWTNTKLEPNNGVT